MTQNPDVIMGVPTQHPFIPTKTIKRKRGREIEGGMPESRSTANKRQHTGASTSHIPKSLPLQPHETILAELRPRYEILTLSIISSTKIEQRVAKILAHLSRFHTTDAAVLPGVVLMHARAREASKMITVVEIVRRRVGREGAKWFQYNRLYEVEAEVSEEPSVIEDTVMGQAAKETNDDDDDDDDFEVMPDRFEKAIVEQKKTTAQPYMSIFFSRVRIPELLSKDFITAQSNEVQIEQQKQTAVGIH